MYTWNNIFDLLENIVFLYQFYSDIEIRNLFVNGRLKLFKSKLNKTSIDFDPAVIPQTIVQ